MKLKPLQLPLILIFLFCLGACVSVGLKPKAPTKSQFYTMADPASPFKKFDNDQTDHAWQNFSNGNTIAVITECSEVQDPDLADLEAETVGALSQVQILKTERTQFSEREAIRTLAVGQVDGISMKMDLLTFKKNNCSYTISYVGREKNFSQDHSLFENFLKEFKVQ